MTPFVQATLRVARRAVGICLAAALVAPLGCAVAEPHAARGAEGGEGGLARVVFLRPSPEASTANFQVLDEHDNVVALVGPESQAMVAVAPGDRRFQLRALGTADLLRADLAPGKTYFVLVSARPMQDRERWCFTALRSDRDWLTEVQAAARRTANPNDDEAELDPQRVAGPVPLGRMDEDEARAHTLRREDGR